MRNPIPRLTYATNFRYYRRVTTDPIAAAAAKRRKALADVENATEHLLDLCAERVRARLDTPDTLAPRAGLSPVSIRKGLRDRGVAALKTGPKPKRAGE